MSTQLNLKRKGRGVVSGFVCMNEWKKVLFTVVSRWGRFLINKMILKSCIAWLKSYPAKNKNQLWWQAWILALYADWMYICVSCQIKFELEYSVKHIWYRLIFLILNVNFKALSKFIIEKHKIYILKSLCLKWLATDSKKIKIYRPRLLFCSRNQYIILFDKTRNYLSIFRT